MCDRQQRLAAAAAALGVPAAVGAATSVGNTFVSVLQPQPVSLPAAGRSAAAVSASPSTTSAPQEPAMASRAAAAVAAAAASTAAVASTGRRKFGRKVASAVTARASKSQLPSPSKSSTFVAPAISSRGLSTAQAQTASASVATAAPVAAETFTVGQKLHGWTCSREEFIEEFACTGYLFTHDRTGAELISMVQPADENKTFGVVFRTPPENSNGIAHVLEHSVLCGSRKYPLKEPFVELLKSSLQTFLNAMTFPDRTCYPVASCNLQDFYNLIDVYLDAVLHPRAVSDPRVLAQEGWHYEIEKKEDPLVFKGVVFNEMKGVYSSPDSSHSRASMSSLFPDTAYGVDSGGDPKEIPNLTFDYLKNFHGKYYHPSNAKFWFYGDDPAARRLELLDEFLRDFDPITPDSEILLQPKFSEPKRMVSEFAVGEDEDISKKAMMSVNWVVAEQKLDVETSMALSFLNYLLVGTPAAPLQRALVESGLGSAVIGGGLYDGLLQPTFSIGLKDIAADDVSKVEDLITKVLTDLSEKGFSDEEVKAAINTIEFRNRELNTGGFPRGLALMFAAVDNWNYGKDPFEPLRFEQPLADLKAKLAKGEDVFGGLIKERLLDNSHRTIVESRPSKTIGKQTEEEEKAKLAAHRETLTDADIASLIEETTTLKNIQETPDDPKDMEKVPRLALSDIAKEVPKVPSEVKGSSPTVLVHALPTSGVVYADIAFSLKYVPENLQSLLPLFAVSLKQLGTAKGDFASLTQRIGMSTGGISATPMCMNKRGQAHPEPYLILRGKSMSTQVPELLDLMKEMALTVNLDNKERFVQLLRQSKSGAQTGIIGAGHRIAAGRLAAQTTEGGLFNERMGGLMQYEYLSKILKDIEEGGWDKISADLKELQRLIFNSEACRVLNITADAANLQDAQSTLEAFAADLPKDAPGAVAAPGKPLGRTAEGIIVPTQVNYVGKGANMYESGYQLHGSALVIQKFLGTTYLWDRVRVSGGAYGGFCQFDVRSGDFKYLSYRDPNLGATWENYDGAPAFLKGLELGEDELSKAIIGCMGDVDSYMLPDAKGYQAMLRYLLEEDDTYRQKLRDQILSTTTKDFHNFAAALDSVTTKGGLCVVGSKDAIEAAKDKYGLSLSSPFAA
eukprot:TRINITY_DN112249_c0_g1_i1.p1 TRINITY_DN112249_c0_g1~~TRINITY_DN112249_c0_g1_i1.p1  ORF type:complete len:1133 (+),score=332.94 TRINITY_DN112249_c0_g1_i1:73-3471(+)